MPREIGDSHQREGKTIYYKELTDDSVLSVRASVYPLTGTTVSLFLSNIDDSFISDNVIFTSAIFLNQFFITNGAEIDDSMRLFLWSGKSPFECPNLGYLSDYLTDSGRKIKTCIRWSFETFLSEAEVNQALKGIFDYVINLKALDVKHINLKKINDCVGCKITTDELENLLPVTSNLFSKLKAKFEKGLYQHIEYSNFYLD